VTLLDELISGLVGATLGEWLQKLVPHRPISEFDSIPPAVLEKRNQTLYAVTGWIGGAAFIGTLLYFLGGGWNHDPWQAGLMVGFPFTSMVLLMLALRLLKGYCRLGEFLRYFELKQQLHIWVISALCAPFATLGLVSFVMLAFHF